MGEGGGGPGGICEGEGGPGGVYEGRGGPGGVSTGCVSEEEVGSE